MQRYIVPQDYKSSGASFTQEDMSMHLNMTQQAYSLIERKPEKASLTHLSRIAEVLQVKVSTLIMEDNNDTQNIHNAQQCNIGFNLNITSSDLYDKFISRLDNEFRVQIKDDLNDNLVDLTEHKRDNEEKN